MGIDIRKLKDQATRALEKRQYAKAAELYLEISLQERDEPDWQQRAGDAFRRAGNNSRAVDHLSTAAEGYATAGFLLKAIAVCKVVLQIDPTHTAIQSFLAGLYAKRDGSTRTASGRVDLVSGGSLGRTVSGSYTAVGASSAPPERADQLRSGPALAPPPNAPPEALPQASRDVDVSIDAVAAPERPATAAVEMAADPMLSLSASGVDLVSLEDRHPPTVAPGPIAGELGMETLALRDLLGGRRAPELGPPPAAAVGEAGTEAAYEIELGGAEDGLAFDEPADGPAVATPDPMSLLSTSSAAQAPARPLAPLPRIPLLSSLPADKLRHLIERMELHQLDEGAAIVREGERGGSLYVVVRGRVTVRIEGPPARDIASLAEGEFFGELAVLTNFPRSASVVADGPVEVLEISRTLVSEIIADSPEVLRTLLRFFRDRLLDRVLATSMLFSSFSRDEARALSQQFRFLEVDPGSRLITEGQRTQGLFVLLCGDADVLRQTGDKLATLKPGDVCGEMSLLTGGAAMASIVTRSKCWVLQLPREGFQEIMMTYPQVLEYVSELAEARRQQRPSSPEESIDFI